MNELTIIEQNGARVLTTSQLAKAYGANPEYINRNFSNNRDRYKPGKHFILLEGESLKEFKMTTGKNNDSLIRANKLYLWTEKGAWLHAKSLNTDEAWDAYEMLVDEYYRIQQQARVLSEREQLIASMKLSLESAQEIAAVKEEVSEIKEALNNQITLDHGQQQTLHHAIKQRVESIKGDYEVSSQKLYAQIHSHLRRAFTAPKYIFIKRKDYADAINWVKTWRPLL